MDKVSRVRAERVSDLLRRYMWARSRCLARKSPAGQLSNLASQIQWGPCESDGVRVELNVEPPIVLDREHPEFFRAIIERDDMAMPELKRLASWRDYVHFGGPMPKDLEVSTRTAYRDDRGRFDVV